jgi:hypothetical protein
MKLSISILFLCLTQWGFSQNMVTFSVDLSEYTGTYTAVNINGIFNNWCGACALMTDDNLDGIYELTVDMAAGQIEYKFTLDAWTEQEYFTPGTPCTITTGNFTNRVYQVSGDATLDTVCWESCSDCSAGPTSADVTFKIDMSTYTGAITVVNLNGTFNGWCGGCAAMVDDNADGIYEITVNLLTGPAEYKFTVDGWDFDETLTEGDPCTETTDGFTNRVINVTEETVLPAVCWESCEACVTGLWEQEAQATFSIFPNPTSGNFQIRTQIHPADLITMRVFNYTGSLVYSYDFNYGFPSSFDMNGLDMGLYLVEIQTQHAIGMQTMLISH